MLTPGNGGEGREGRGGKLWNKELNTFNNENKQTVVFQTDVILFDDRIMEFTVS